MNVKSVCGFSLVVPQGKWTWTDGAGAQSGVAVVSVFTVLAVISGCVVLAALFRSNQCIIVRKKDLQLWNFGTFSPRCLYFSTSIHAYLYISHMCAPLLILFLILFQRMLDRNAPEQALYYAEIKTLKSPVCSKSSGLFALTRVLNMFNKQRHVQSGSLSGKGSLSTFSP